MANKEYEEYKSKAKGEPLPSYTYTPRPINIDFNASYSPGRVPMPTYTPRSTPTPTQEEYTVPIPEHLMAPAREVATPSPSPIPTNPPRFRNNQVISPDSNPFAIGNMLWNFMAPMAIGSYALSKPKMPSPLVHTSYPPGSVSPVSYSNPSDFISYPATTPVALPPGTRQPYYNMPGKFNALGEALPKAPTTVSNAIANIQKPQIPPSLMANIRASLQPDITIPPNVMADLKLNLRKPLQLKLLNLLRLLLLTSLQV
jgi:hypothetical protein